MKSAEVCSGRTKYQSGLSPVNRYRHEGEDARAYGDHRYELADLAVEVAEGPMAVEHVGVVEYDVERGDHRVGDAEIDEEVVGDGAHALVRQHYPDDDEVAPGGDDNHAREEHRPDDLPPPRQDELVRVLLVVGLAVVDRGDVARRVERELEQALGVAGPEREAAAELGHRLVGAGLGGLLPVQDRLYQRLLERRRALHHPVPAQSCPRAETDRKQALLR